MKSNYNIKRSNKFKTNYLQVRYLIDATKNNTSYTSLLSMYLTYANNEHPTYKEATDYLDSLYGTKFDIVISLKGDKIAFDVILVFVANKYLKDEAYLDEVINVYLTYLFNPVLVADYFNAEFVELKKYEFTERIRSTYDDKFEYATEKFLEFFAKDNPLALNLAGYLDDIEQIDGKKLFIFYQELIKQTPIIGGNVCCEDYDKIIALLETRIMKLQTVATFKLVPLINTSVAEEIEEQDIVQSKLAIGYTINDEINNESYYYYFMINVLFGLSSNSYLFKIIRERENLCYSIRSNFSQYFNCITLMAGINKKNYQKTVDLVEEIMSNMQAGKITQEEFTDAKIVATDLIQKTKDSQLGLVNYDLNRTMLDFNNDLNQDIIAINNIDLTLLIEKTKRIKLKSKYLLSGEKDE